MEGKRFNAVFPYKIWDKLDKIRGRVSMTQKIQELIENEYDRVLGKNLQPPPPTEKPVKKQVVNPWQPK